MDIRWSDWAHVMFSTRGHWLPGDPRGFRDHNHRIHSSGDYKRQPPATEHAGLRRYAKSISKRQIVFSDAQQQTVADAFIEKLNELRYSVRALCVDAVHAHVLMRAGLDDAEQIAARIKQFSSHRVGRDLPGHVWGQKSHVVRIRSEAHYRAVVKYIERHRAKNAIVWVHPRYARFASTRSWPN